MSGRMYFNASNNGAESSAISNLPTIARIVLNQNNTIRFSSNNIVSF